MSVLVFNDSFPSGAAQWLGFNGTHPFHGSDHGSAISTCGRYGALLGGHGVLGRGAWTTNRGAAFAFEAMERWARYDWSPRPEIYPATIQTIVQYVLDIEKIMKERKKPYGCG